MPKASGSNVVVYNTLSEKKETLRPVKDKALKLFVCGPTVYGPAHLGHSRVEVFFDIMARYLRFLEYKLLYLQNITDVDDKIINRARAERTTPQRLARQYEREYLSDMKELRITSVDRRVRASEHIAEIKRQIERLMEKGYAYTISSGVYFSVRKFKEYGKLSKQNLDDLRPGWRIEPDEEKQDPLDFALWKFSKSAGEIGWPSSWGRGRPGWHIEDTAITEQLLGQQYDIHGGGVDLKFPHHESEIAQQEAASQKKPFVKYWMHVGFVTVDGEKMSKSLNNTISIKSFLERYSVNVFRLLIASSHYRSPINYTESLAEQTVAALHTIEDFLGRLDFVAAEGKTKAAPAAKTTATLLAYRKEFVSAMNDDFNTPAALATLFKLINQYQDHLWELHQDAASDIRNFLVKKCTIFGLLFKKPIVPIGVRALLRKRENLRGERKFGEADMVRGQIEALGFTIEDTPLGPLARGKNLETRK